MDLLWEAAAGTLLPWDAPWMRRYMALTGKHWIQTDEGWEPGETFDGSGDVEILDEIKPAAQRREG